MLVTTGLNRDTIDKFYTKAVVAQLCCDNIQNYISINPDIDVIIEPSAGNGSFIIELTKLSNNCLFYDIQPEHDTIVKQDYLLFDIHEFELPDLHSRIHVIGNPPFGRQSSLAIKFIKKSAEFCDTISFILPKSFKKDSMRKHFPLHFHLVYQCDLDKDSFTVDGIDHNVESVFQIWERKLDKRIVTEKIEPDNFVFVSKTENPHISFRRVGVYAGKIDTRIDEKSEQSHYFIRFTNNKSIDDNIQLLQQIHFNHDNTVGPKSISKQELICEFNKYI